jgi:hypothetical protein
MKSHFINSLTNLDHLEGKWFKANNSLAFYSAKYDLTICSPPGIVIDFSSVPRIPFAYWIAGNTNHWEAVIHDTMYRFFYERVIADLIFFEASKLRSAMRENQTWLHRTGRFVRSSLMTATVLSVGWIDYDPLPGCLDYRKKKTCGRKCLECGNYYYAWSLCKMDGHRPEILDIHGAT